MAIARAVVYYARAANAFSAGIKFGHYTRTKVKEQTQTENRGTKKLKDIPNDSITSVCTIDLLTVAVENLPGKLWLPKN